jgi:hypothetical protein
MESVISSAKIGKIFEIVQKNCGESYQKLLLSGNLLGFERSLMEDLLGVYNEICAEMLCQMSELLLSFTSKQGSKWGMSKLQKRSVWIRISTGYEVMIWSYYSCIVSEDFSGSRYLLLRYWGVVEKCSPSYYDKVGMVAIISPSYSISSEVLMKLNIISTVSHTRDLMNGLGAFCAEKEASLVLSPGENVSGLRVVISIDGGRTRTREYSGVQNENGNDCYATPWREPKLFVITTLDKDGKADKKRLPIYGCRFEESAVLELLKNYLVLLKIKTAESVQLIADGAKWIWTSLKNILIELGVSESKIVETIDYCHAVSYVHSIVKALPKNEKGIILTTSWDEKNGLRYAKDSLWKGEIKEFISLSRQLIPEPNQEINQAINYLDKHQNRMQYAYYQDNKYMCGSGIIESGIRRIINLRFKNTSSFWLKNNVQRLYIFRAILVSKRWNIFINNLVKLQI